MKRAAVLLLLPVVAVSAAPPSFQDLMRPDCLPEPQYGMRVESAALSESQLRIVTTGAELAWDLDGDGAVFRQRIGAQREVLRFRVEGRRASDPELTHRGPGFAFARFGSPRFDLRVNGDSLFMLHAIDPLEIALVRAIEPGFVSSDRSNHVVFDEYGGFGVYCSVPDINDHFEPYAEAENARSVVARYALPADAVLWIAVCPPKPYDWDRSARDQVIWHWSDRQGYPPDDVLAGWAKFGNIVLLQSEVMLWKDWNLGFEPREGAGEFSRVRRTVHDLGMRFIVYTSPYYFLRGTDRESAAINSFADFKGWPSGTPTGENIELFLGEISRLVAEHKPDGLYFDGQYIDNPAALYLLARRARAVVGEDGLLEWHSTQALGADLCSLPPADAYVNLILRGEGREALYQDESYLRYFVSGYNVHNSVGVICNNGSRPTAEFLERLLDLNGRTHTLAGWLQDDALVGLVNGYMQRRADVAGLQQRVARTLERRQAAIPGQVRDLVRERRELTDEPRWGEAVLETRFESPDGWNRTVSPHNPAEAVRFGADGLQVRAAAHTFAFVERTLDRRVNGWVARIQRGTDAGMSWGPAVCLRFSEQDFIRVGVRSDGLVQADICGDQRVAVGGPLDPETWVRVRWGGSSGVIEQSSDGRNFARLLDFRHGGRLTARVQRILVGKVPYDGRPHDFTDPGPVGACAFPSLSLY